MTAEPTPFRASVVGRTPDGGVSIALITDGEPVIVSSSADSALSLIAAIAESLRSDNAPRVPRDE